MDGSIWSVCVAVAVAAIYRLIVRYNLRIVFDLIANVNGLFWWESVESTLCRLQFFIEGIEKINLNLQPIVNVNVNLSQPINSG